MMGSKAKEVVKFILMDCSDGHKEWYEKKPREKKILKEKKTHYLMITQGKTRIPYKNIGIC